MSMAPKAPLLRRLTSKGSSGRRGQSSSESSVKGAPLGPPSTFTLSNVSSEPSAGASVTPATIQIGAEKVSLPTLSIGVTLLLLAVLLGRAFLTFSASLFRLAILVLFVACIIIFAPLPDKMEQQRQKRQPPVGAAYPAPNVDDSTLELLNQYRRQHERQSSFR